MTDYTAQDGLNILNYFGIKDLSEKEKNIFREVWNGVYLMRKNNSISATWTIYSQILPFRLLSSEREGFLTSQVRDQEFGKCLDDTELDKKLKEGTPLEEIIKKSA
mgnify:CR=1 FL=1